MPSAQRSGAVIDAPIAAARHGAGPTATVPVGAMFGLLSMPHVDVIMSVVLALPLLTVVGGLVYAFWREARNNTAFLEPIEVPHELARRAFSTNRARCSAAPPARARGARARKSLPSPTRSCPAGNFRSARSFATRARCSGGRRHGSAARSPSMPPLPIDRRR
jgi:hypothetical protein